MNLKLISFDMENPNNPSPKMYAKRGFTLVETIVAIALFTVVVITAYQAFRTGYLAYTKVETSLGYDHEFNMLVRDLNQELRNAAYYANEPFLGESDSIRFPTKLWRFEDKIYAEDLYVVEYQFKGRTLERKEEKIKKRFGKSSPAEKEKLLDFDVLKFQYAYQNASGAIKWENEWSSERYLGLPRGIRLAAREKGVSRDAGERVVQILIPQGVLGEIK